MVGSSAQKKADCLAQKKVDCWVVKTVLQRAVSSAQKMVESSAQKTHLALPTVQASPALDKNFDYEKLFL